MGKSKLEKLSYIIILAGILIRIVGIGVMPAGLNCDEASTAYDSYSILTTLHDRNNVFLPVYPLAWGLGQSSLLMYIMLPFIKILGLNIISTRLPMAIISSISLIVFYKILIIAFDDKNDDKKFFALFGLLFFALNPWHIMKSRWGLDCNLFPDVMLFGIYFLIKYFKYENKKTLNLVLSFAFFSISAYSYASSYLGLSIFSILILIYSFKKHSLNIKQFLLIVLTVALIAWPLMLHIIVNFFDLNTIELPFMTILKLRSNRMFNNTVLSDTNIFISLLKNIFNSLKLYIIQYDTYYWNGIRGIGMYYLFSFPIFVVGFINYIRDNFIEKNSKNETDNVFFIWLISGFICNLFHSQININRANIIIFPIIYFIIKGFILLFKIKKMKLISIVLLLFSFAIFSYIYIDGNIKKENGILIEGINYTFADCFEVGLDKVLKHANDLGAEEITFFSKLSETTAYIYVLYYLQIDPKQYYKTRKLYDESKGYLAVKSFDKWRFDRPNSLSMDKKFVYIFEKEILPIIDRNYFNVDEIGDYIVVQYKGDNG